MFVDIGPVTRSKTFSRANDVPNSDGGYGLNGAIEAAADFLSKSEYPSFKVVISPKKLQIASSLVSPIT